MYIFFLGWAFKIFYLIQKKRKKRKNVEKTFFDKNNGFFQIYLSAPLGVLIHLGLSRKHDVRSSFVDLIIM